MSAVKRSWAKAFTYFVSSILLMGATVAIVTGNPWIALKGMGAYVLPKMLWYFTHERLWNNIEWGKHAKQSREN